jgi:hypothetical protein
MIYRTAPKPTLQLLDCFEDLLDKLGWLQKKCGDSEL